MFEVGKVYQIHLIEGGNESESAWEVVEVNLPLIKVRNSYSADRIINTSSPMFVRAELSRHQSTKPPRIG